MKTYDQVMQEIRQRRRARWARILASEPPGRPPGRRPRDPEQERILLQLDRARLERREREGAVRVRTPEPGNQE
jgi:hypothetical protein